MSQLRSLLDEMAAVEDHRLSAEDLAADIVELTHVEQMVEVLRARKAKHLADRGGHHQLGYSSPTALLTHQTGISPGRARSIVSLGNARQKAPFAHRAWADGRISTDQARHLFRAAEAVPDEYPEAEERLVDIIEGLDAVDTGKAVEYWRQAVDGPGDLDAEAQWVRRGIHLSPSIRGMRKVDGWLTDSAGEALETAVDANMPPPREGDTRTPAQRRHDALENLCRDWLDNGTTPTVGGEKPHISLLVDLDALRGIAGGTHETISGHIIDIDTVRMISCDSSITRIVLGPESEILDVGRKTRVWTTAQRRAIVARGRHCQGPGCRARPRHCDIHHEDHWADGGDTSVEKGRLFCRPCHTIEHLKERFRRRIRSRTEG
jgi:hypothetical protein